MYSLTPFDVFAGFSSPFRERVYVVSDTQYNDYKKAQAEEYIRTLEARATDYRRNLEILETTVAEIKKEHGLLPAAKENDKSSE